MSARFLLYVQGVVAALVGVLQLIGLEHFLYRKFWWYGIPLHFLGGVWVALGALWLASLFKMHLRWFAVLGIVVAVGMAWEVWEVAAGLYPEENYGLDTSLDLVMDIAGGVITLVILRFCAGSRATIDV